MFSFLNWKLASCYQASRNILHPVSLISGPSQLLPQWKCLPYLRTISAATTVEVPPLSQDHLLSYRCGSVSLISGPSQCYHSGSASRISGPSQLLPQWTCLPYLRTISLLPQWKCLPYLRTISAATTVEVPPLSQDHLPAATVEVPPLSQDHLSCYHSGSASLISGPSQLLPQWKCLPYLRTIFPATTVEVPYIRSGLIRTVRKHQKYQ